MARRSEAAVTRVMRLEALGVGLLLRLFEALNPARASDLGGWFCRLIGPLLPVSRVADANLRLALPELDRRARRRIIRGVWENLGRTAAEFPHLRRLRKDTPFGPGWHLEGEEFLREQSGRGGPVIFVSGHIGNWELLPRILAHYGFRVSSMYRAAGNPLIDQMIGDLRTQGAGANLPFFPKGATGARRALAHIAGGGTLALLADQKMNDGIEARFFGHKAMTAGALAAIALRHRVPVIPGYAERIGPARFRLVCESPMQLPDTGDRQRDQAALTQAVNDRLECWIRRKPETWLWLHRRWPKDILKNSLNYAAKE